MISVHQACDYIITRVCEGDALPSLNVLKLQKLLYYSQAWHLAFYGTRLFDENFQAWVHGPVSPEIFHRLKTTKMLYSSVGRADRQPDFDPEAIPEETRRHIDSILEIYAGFTDTQLESLTHFEEPWTSARAGIPPSQPSARGISDDVMRDYYRSRMKAAEAT